MVLRQGLLRVGESKRPRHCVYHAKLARDGQCASARVSVACSSFPRLHNSTGGGLYVAFNTSHRPTAVELPHWHGRTWQPFIDSGKVTHCSAPCIFFRAV